MKKLALVIALAAAASAAQAVEVYGTLDAGFQHLSDSTNDINLISSGVSNDSLIGIKAGEDLGSGLRASAVLEAGVAVDSGATGTGQLFNRESSLGLSMGSSSLKIGRTMTNSRIAQKQFDVFAGAKTGFSRNLMDTNGNYLNNSVVYNYGSNGITASAQHAFGEQVNGGFSNGSTDSLAVGYAAGPLAGSLTYERVDQGARTTTLGASYDFTAAKVSVLAQSASQSALDNNFLVGVKAPITGALTAMASYGHLKLTNVDQRVNAYTLGGEYSMSKRTQAYASVGRIDGGSSVDQFSAGIRHSF